MKAKRPLAIAALTVCLAAGGSVVATAEPGEVIVGNLVLRADGGFRPTELPRRRRVPIRFQGYATIRTKDKSPPPALRRVKLDFDRDGRLNVAGLPTCPPGRLEARTAKQARRLCKGAIVGKGRVSAVIDLPGARFRVRSPLTLFNGPRQGGNPTVVAHAQTGVPIFQAYVVVAPIERRRGRTFGYRTSFEVPPIAGGAGSLTRVQARLGRRYTHRGKRRSYVTARCSDGILQTQGYFGFADGNVIYGSVFRSCTAR
jgi:hypothetical protein